MYGFKLSNPKKLSEEERKLQIKYATLRDLKQTLYKKHKNSNLQDSLAIKSSQSKLKRAAGQVLEASDKVLSKESTKVKKTSGFKRSKKQNEGYQAVQKKNVMTEFAPETDLHSRSITVHGTNLKDKLLRETFEKFGDIIKISLGFDHESAVVTYKTPEHARMASVVKHPVPANQDTNWTVNFMKKRNSSWVDIAVKEAIKNDASDQGLNTVHISYEGKLTMHDLKYIFRSVGKIEKIYISSLRAMSPQKQFAFVTFQFENEAERAVGEVNGKVHNGVTLTVSLNKKTFKNYSFANDTIQDVESRELIDYDYLET